MILMEYVLSKTSVATRFHLILDQATCKVSMIALLWDELRQFSVLEA